MFTLSKHRLKVDINDLYDDLLVEILSRLSIKQLVSCKSVSKRWCTLISTICIPRLKSSPPHAIIFRRRTLKKRGPWSFVSMDSPNPHITNLIQLCPFLPFVPSPDEFLDYCNGCFLFYHQPWKLFYVCNPSTEQYIGIPYMPFDKTPNSGALIFDPQCQVVYIELQVPLKMYLFSLETEAWAVHSLHLDRSVLDSGVSKRRITADGLVYMLAASGHLLKLYVKDISIQAIKLPVTLVEGQPLGCIGMSRGRLHYAWEDIEFQVIVWVLGEGATHEWFLKHAINHQYFVDHPIFQNQDGEFFFFPYAFDPDSDVIFGGNHIGIYQYDLCTKRLQRVCRLNKRTFMGYLYVFPFSRNLTSLGALSQQDVHALQLKTRLEAEMAARREPL